LQLKENQVEIYVFRIFSLEEEAKLGRSP